MACRFPLARCNEILMNPILRRTTAFFAIKRKSQMKSCGDKKKFNYVQFGRATLQLAECVITFQQPQTGFKQL